MSLGISTFYYRLYRLFTRVVYAVFGRSPKRATLYKLFKNPKLCDLALYDTTRNKKEHMRLAWLGDAVLCMIARHFLYKRYPHIDEGVLSHLSQNLVSNETLEKAVLVSKLEFGLNRRIKQVDPLPDKFYANLFEALVGALYLDRGLKLCTQKVLLWLHEPLSELPKHPHANSGKKNKTLLQEYLQARQLTLPVYTCQRDGASGLVRVRCIQKETDLSSEATGLNQKEAADHAARDLLHSLKNTKNLN